MKKFVVLMLVLGIASFAGASLSWTDGAGNELSTITLTSQSDTEVVEIHSDYAWPGWWYATMADTSVAGFQAATVLSAAVGQLTAGHGGKDPGAVRRYGTKETIARKMYLLRKGNDKGWPNQELTILFTALSASCYRYYRRKSLSHLSTWVQHRPMSDHRRSQVRTSSSCFPLRGFSAMLQGL